MKPKMPLIQDPICHYTNLTELTAHNILYAFFLKITLVSLTFMQIQL